MNRKAKALEFVDEGYNITVTGRHVQITDSMKDYALEKVSKIERFMNRIIDVNIIMDIQKLEHRVEIIFKAGHTKVTSQAVTNDMYASIDKAVNKLERQILRYKSKLQDHHAKGLAVIDMNVNILKRPTDEEEETELEEEETDNSEALNGEAVHEIVQETRPLKTLTAEEAMMKMELSQDSFLLYKSEEDLKLKVIYRRSDGNYGVIEPQC
ncbi:MAG: ribosome-associated translation inhibitor RaiA [Candidatus Protochlamydia sp.]|nr:ribosome-associated translation inhibitor RaiA [Candidatus Protochlamydia sp.]